jgi:hypothetical protein
MGQDASVASDRRALFVGLLLATSASGCALSHQRTSATEDAGAPTIDAGPCSGAQQFFQPGCGSEGIHITPGCYEPCAGPEDTHCGPGLICEQTSIDPCVCAPGLECCRACGADQWLCLPWHSTPVTCEGRDYCTCSGACAALIDLSPGCVCPCDEPFVCGGPPCDCDCGGAQYLGCALADRCPTPQVRCESPGRAHLVDGCPTCDP